MNRALAQSGGNDTDARSRYFWWYGAPSRRRDAGVNRDITVRSAVSTADPEAAFRLRHDVYVREMGFRQSYADSAGRLVDAFDDTAILLIACIGDTVVGTLRSNFGANSDFGPFVEIGEGVSHLPHVGVLMTH